MTKKKAKGFTDLHSIIPLAQKILTFLVGVVEGLILLALGYIYLASFPN